MRRLISFLTAAVLVAGPLATAGQAMGKDHHDNGGGRPEQRGGRGEGRGDDGHGDGGHGDGGGRWNGGGRGPPAPYRGGGGGRSEHVDPRSDYRGDYRGDPRSDNRGDYRGEFRADPRYDPRGYGPPPSAYSAAPRRGGYLEPRYGGAVIQDYGRLRLRAPPRGYAWVQTPGGMALVSQSTGQVFDVVPN